MIPGDLDPFECPMWCPYTCKGYFRRGECLIVTPERNKIFKSLEEGRP